MRDQFIARLQELASKDKRIMLVTGDLGFGVFNRFRQELPAQFLNAGVAEQNMTGLATGLALEGLIVFTYSIANFPTLRCLEQIRNDACYHQANVKVVAIGGGFSYGALGISHHATEDLAIMRALPEMTVVAPCGLWEAQEATSALVDHQGTCYLRLDKSWGQDDPRPGERFVLGQARVLQQGADCTLFVCGGILGEVWKANEILQAQGIRPRIVSMHTIKPLDEQAVVDAAQQTGAIFTIEEHSIQGGLGGAVAETLAEYGVWPRVFSRLGLRAGFSSIVGSQEYLRQRYGLDAVSLAQEIREKLKPRG